MSETLATSVLEIENRTDLSGNYGAETIDKQWARDDLTPLVAANANTLVIWGGAEVTLSEAIRNYLERNSVTEEGQEIVIAVALELLANPVIKIEAIAEEDKPKEKEPAKTEEADQKNNTKTEVQKVQENPNKVPPQKQSKNEIDNTKRLEPSASRAKKDVSSVIAAEAGVVANLGQGESKQYTQGAVKAEVDGSSSKSSADTTSRDSTAAPRALAVTSSTSGSSAPESVNDRTGQEFKAVASSAKNQLDETRSAIKSEVYAKQQIPTFEIPEAYATANRIVEAKPAPDRRQLVANQETESLTLPVAIEATGEAEPTELSLLDLESVAISDDTAELSDEKIEVAEDESALAALDHQMGADGLTDFVEEALPDHFEETGLEPDELYSFSDIPALEVIEDNLEAGEEASISELSNESNLSGQMEISNLEQPVQISLTIEEIEDSLIQLTERIKDSEPETTTKVNEILDKIIGVPAKFKAHNGENVITEAEAQEELEELFTELLNKMAIDYAPELIESLARLTFKWHLADEIEKLKNEEETDKAPQERGTHEIIKKLLVRLSIIKKAMAHAYIIGKSALQLYVFNFAT